MSGRPIALESPSPTRASIAAQVSSKVTHRRRRSTAAFGNLPLAVILISGALRILRLTATRLWFLEPGTPAWRLPLVP